VKKAHTLQTIGTNWPTDSKHYTMQSARHFKTF